jgi:thiol-disulfide isomerase/thioredoxin
MKRILLVLLACAPYLAFAQYPTIKSKLSISSDQWTDTTAFLALHIGNQLKVTDTLRFDQKGKSSLKKNFTKGQYEIVFADRKQHHLIINEKKIKLKHIDGSIDYSRSKENSIFDAFLNIQNEIDRKRKVLANDETKTIMLSQQLDRSESKRLFFIASLEKQLENTLVKKIIDATCMPNDLGYYEANIEIAKFKERSFLGNAKPSDPEMLFTQIFHERIKFYLTKLNNESKEQFLEELTWVIERSKLVEYNYQYMIDFWLGYFQRSKNPMHELAFELIVKEYVLSGQTPWIEDWKQQRLEAQLQFLANQKLDDKPPVFKLFTPENELIDYESKREKYQLLLIWDPHCGHCIEEVPEYAKIYYRHRQNGFSVVAIYDQTDKEAWIEFIKKHDLTWINGADMERKGNFTKDIIVGETPTALLLNSEGIIVEKRLSPTELDKFLKEALY